MKALHIWKKIRFIQKYKWSVKYGEIGWGIEGKKTLGV